VDETSDFPLVGSLISDGSTSSSAFDRSLSGDCIIGFCRPPQGDEKVDEKELSESLSL